MNEKLNILLIEDNPGDARLIRELLTMTTSAFFHLQVVDRLSSGLERLAAGSVDVVLLDLSLPDSQGLKTFAKAHTQAPQTPIIVLTGLDDETRAMAAMRDGAQDYLVKGQVDGNLLARSIRYAVERKQAEESLRQSEEMYRKLFSEMFSGCALHEIVCDSAGQAVDYVTLEINKAFESLMNARSEEVVGRKASEILPEEELKKWLEIFGPVALTGKSIHYEMYSPLNKKHFEGAAYCPDRGKFAVTFSDITERKRAEQALMESSAQFHTLFEASPDAIMLVDPHDNWLILDCNTAACQMNGYTQDELIGQSIDVLNLMPGDPTEHAKYMERIRRNSVLHLETLHRRKDGTAFPIEVSTSLITLGGRDVVLGIDRDITERKQMEARLRDQVAALQALSEIDHEIMAATEPQGILDLVCRRAAELVHAPKSAIAIGTSSDEMKMAASYGLSDPARASQEFAQFWQTGEMRPAAPGVRATIALDDVSAAAPQMPELAASENARALALVPLAAGEETSGMLVVLDTAPREWNADELDALGIIAGQAAIALEKVRLYQAARNRALHLALLNEIDQAITSTLDLDRVLLTLLNRVQQISRAEACSVALVDKATGDLVFRQAVGTVAQAVIGLRLKPGRGIAGWVAVHRQSALVTQVASDSRFYGYIDRDTSFATRDLICAPLIAHETVAGVIELLNKQSGTFDQNDVQLLESVATQAAIAIENARLYEETRRRVTELSTLNEIGREFSLALTLEGVCQAIYRQVSRVFEAANFFISTYQESSQEWELVLEIRGGQPGQTGPHKMGKGLTGYILRTRQPVLFHTAEENERFYREHDLERIGPIAASWMSVPLLAGGGVVGAMAMRDDERENLYGDQDLELFSTIAAQAAIAIQNARLFEAQRRQAEDLDAINAVIRVSASSLDLDALLNGTMRELYRLVAFDRASLALIDESRQVFTMMALGTTPLQDSGRPVLGTGVTMSMQDTAAADDVRAGRTHLTDDLSTETAFPGERMLFQAGLRSRVNVPLLHAGQVMGALNLASTRPAAFDRHQVSLLEQVAGPLAIAIENARLFERERVQRQRLETLYRIGQAINTTLDANAILDRLTDEAMRATHATHGSALIARPDLNRFERLSLRGYSPELAETARTTHLPLGHGVNSRAYATRRVIYLADVRQDADYFPLVPDTRSELAVPLIRGGQVVGNLDLQSPEVDAFHDIDLDFLRALTDQVAVALENARLFEETHRRLEELAVISQVALVGAAGRPFDETVERATQALTQLWPDAFLGFLFVDEATRSLRPHPSYYGVPPETLASLSIPLDQGITGWAARVRQPVRVSDVNADPRYLAKIPGIQSEMAAPLVASDRVLGIVNVDSPQPDAFAGEDLRLLTTLAGQLATIFEKARLDAELARHAATLERRVQERTAELRAANEQLRQAHEQVRLALEKERELGELKSRFISMTSHEFRTPLSSIQSSSELIEHYGHKWTEEKKLQHLKRIQTGVSHMVQLLDDVLTIGRAEAGKLEFAPAMLDVESFCRDLMEEMQLQAGAAHRLIFASRGQCADVCLDEKLLRQILANLLSNAIKYSPQGGEVRLELDCLADQVVLRVQDHGIGIPPEEHGRLFDTFHRAANVGNIPGTGLGLSIIKKAVDRHGGTITFTSQVNAGAAFTVTIPLSQPTPEENP